MVMLSGLNGISPWEPAAGHCQCLHKYKIFLPTDLEAQTKRIGKKNYVQNKLPKV